MYSTKFTLFFKLIKIKNFTTAPEILITYIGSFDRRNYYVHIWTSVLILLVGHFTHWPSSNVLYLSTFRIGNWILYSISGVGSVAKSITVHGNLLRTLYSIQIIRYPLSTEIRMETIYCCKLYKEFSSKFQGTKYNRLLKKAREYISWKNVSIKPKMSLLSPKHLVWQNLSIS